jgi:hypothetical protein
MVDKFSNEAMKGELIKKSKQHYSESSSMRQKVFKSKKIKENSRESMKKQYIINKNCEEAYNNINLSL